MIGIKAEHPTNKLKNVLILWFGQMKLFLFIPMFLLLIGCKEKSEETNQEEQSIQFVPTLLSFQSCFTAQENEVSFPSWFNDSIIRERKIARIHREYVVPDTDSGEVYTRMLKIYDFDKKGILKQLTVQEFYEGVLINESKFAYSSAKDKYGFAEVKRLKSEIHYPDHFRIYAKTYYQNYLRYTGEDSNEKMFFVPNNKLWKVLAIDTLFSPGEKDVVVFGTPNLPHRAFKIRNKVEESDVVEYTYSNGGQVIREMSLDKYPFITKRTFRYEKDNRCGGFVDSLYSGDHFLHALECTISYESIVLPVTIEHKFITTEGAATVREREILKYEYYE
jgi:hypothetical protein